MYIAMFEYRLDDNEHTGESKCCMIALTIVKSQTCVGRISSKSSSELWNCFSLSKIAENNKFETKKGVGGKIENLVNTSFLNLS